MLQGQSDYPTPRRRRSRCRKHWRRPGTGTQLNPCVQGMIALSLIHSYRNEISEAGIPAADFATDASMSGWSPSNRFFLLAALKTVRVAWLTRLYSSKKSVLHLYYKAQLGWRICFVAHDANPMKVRDCVYVPRIPPSRTEGCDRVLKGHVQALIDINGCAPDHQRDRIRVASVWSKPDTGHPVHRAYNNGFPALLIERAARSSSCSW